MICEAQARRKEVVERLEGRKRFLLPPIVPEAYGAGVGAHGEYPKRSRAMGHARTLQKQPRQASLAPDPQLWQRRQELEQVL